MVDKEEKITCLSCGNTTKKEFDYCPKCRAELHSDKPKKNQTFWNGLYRFGIGAGILCIVLYVLFKITGIL